MKISFDFDGTLTIDKFKNLAQTLLKSGNEIYIITNRWTNNMKQIYEFAESIGIKKENIFETNNKSKAELILNKNLDIDLHFDNDFFDVDDINKKTDTLGVLVSLDLYFNNEV